MCRSDSQGVQTTKITPGSFGDVHLALHLVLVVVVGLQLESIAVSHC